jgi:hypothetical protein
MSEQRLKEFAAKAGDMREVRSQLADKGYRASILLKGPNDRIKMECAAGGKGVNAQHTWTATPFEVLFEANDCPHCRLDNHIKNDPPEEVSEAVLIKAVKEQHKILAKSAERARRKTRRFGNNFGISKYTL